MKSPIDKPIELVTSQQLTPEDKLLNEAEKQTRFTLKEFIRKARRRIEDGTRASIINSIVAAIVGVAYSFGAAEFRTEVFWGFVRRWNFKDNRTGLKFLNYDLMLYPFYADHFDNVISAEIWADMQGFATANVKKYKDDPKADPKCIAHWESIITGVVPYGYAIKVIEDKTSGIKTDIKTQTNQPGE